MAKSSLQVIDLDEKVSVKKAASVSFKPAKKSPAKKAATKKKSPAKKVRAKK